MKSMEVFSWSLSPVLRALGKLGDGASLREEIRKYELVSEAEVPLLPTKDSALSN